MGIPHNYYTSAFVYGASTFIYYFHVCLKREETYMIVHMNDIFMNDIFTGLTIIVRMIKRWDMRYGRGIFTKKESYDSDFQ